MHLSILILVTVCFTGLAGRHYRRLTFYILNTKYIGRFAIISRSVYFTLSFISSILSLFLFLLHRIAFYCQLFPLRKTKVTPSGLREPLQGTEYR